MTTMLKSSLPVAAVTLVASFMGDINWQTVSVAVGASLLGAITETAMTRQRLKGRRKRSRGSTVLLVMISTGWGILIGSGAVLYLQVSAVAYALIAYAMSGLLALILVKAFLTVANTNAETWLSKVAGYFGYQIIEHVTQDTNENKE